MNTQEQLQRAMDEAREEIKMLRREVQHRVKNNLQLVETLLDMTSNQLRDHEARNLVATCRKRVASIALIHQALCQGEAIHQIELAVFIDDLTRNLCRQTTMETRITIQNNSGDIIWDPDRCLDLGLVLAELIANADEHAFRNQADRTIHIELSRPAPDQLELTISDNGAGFPQEPPPEQAHTLGLPLVRSIVERNFNGSLLLENTPGATITIRLPAA